MKRAEPTGFNPLLKIIKDLEWHHHDCWIGECPLCHQRELRASETEKVKCPSCGLWTFGVEESLERVRRNSRRTLPRKLPKVEEIVLPGEDFPDVVETQLGTKAETAEK